MVSGGQLKTKEIVTSWWIPKAFQMHWKTKCDGKVNHFVNICDCNGLKNYFTGLQGIQVDFQSNFVNLIKTIFCNPLYLIAIQVKNENWAEVHWLHIHLPISWDQISILAIIIPIINTKLSNFHNFLFYYRESDIPAWNMMIARWFKVMQRVSIASKIANFICHILVYIHHELSYG